MILGRVVGEVWATRRHPRLRGMKLLVVAPRAWYDPPQQVGHLVAVDPVGAGVGEEVVVCFGEPARRAVLAAQPQAAPEAAAGDDWSGVLNLPIDAAIAAIVDRTDISEGLP